MGWGGGWVAKHTHTQTHTHHMGGHEGKRGGRGASQMKFFRFCMTTIEPVQKPSRSNDVSNIVQSTKSNITK